MSAIHNVLAGSGARFIVNTVYSSNTADANINVSTLPGYIAGASDITITVNSGVYVYATSTSNAGMTISGAILGDTVTLVNNGFIMGQGGTGSAWNGSPSTGGPALNLNTSISVTNNSYIGGGGGGGGKGGEAGGGGGAGGGTGGKGAGSGSAGAGGGPGASGSNGGGFYNAGGGGRVMPGSGGQGGFQPAANNFGRGGTAGGGGAAGYVGGTGGSGGSAGNTGNNGTNPGGGGGGGWGASGGFGVDTTIRSGASGGKAVGLNGNTITWLTLGTVYGAIS